MIPIPMDRHQQFVIIALGLLFAGLFSAWIWRTAGHGIFIRVFGALHAPSSEQGSVGGLAAERENAIAVNDQPAGTAVSVALVTLARDGWVAIHEEHDGAPGNILGAQRFNRGANQSGSVELLRPTEEGRLYFAMLHTDDGDHQFDHMKDLPLEDRQGNIVLMRFIATAPSTQR